MAAAKLEHVHCSKCGKRCSGVDPELGLVVRAFVECPECLEKEPPTPRDLLAAVVSIDAVPCGQHRDHDYDDGVVYYCPWCEADVLVDEHQPFTALVHQSDCPAERARRWLAS